jgi:hypothetical protein
MKTNICMLCDKSVDRAGDGCQCADPVFYDVPEFPEPKERPGPVDGTLPRGRHWPYW